MRVLRNAWRRLPKQHRNTWMLLGGALMVGTVFKVSYFRFSRGLMVNSSQKINEEGHERLREAREFAKWSERDRSEKIPALTAEQRQQLQKYLQIVHQHGVNRTMAAADDENCVGCPIVGSMRKTAAAQKE